MLIKSVRKAAEAAQSAKLRKMGAYGSMKDAKKGEDAPRKYASGGAVNMGPVDGGPAKPNLGRPGRKAGGAKGAKKGGTNVNVIVMPKPDGAAMPKAPPAMDMPPPAAAGPMPMPPPGPGPGGPMPMPMRKSGGAVKAYKSGGKVAHDDVKEDKALIKSMVKSDAMKPGKRAKGGKI